MATYSSDVFTDEFQHTGECPNPNKPLKQTLTIDDGTGKLYGFNLTKDLEWKEYTITPEFTTDPVEPTILDETDIIPGIVDSYDVVETDGIDYDFSEDGIITEKQEDETIVQILSVPNEQIIKQSVRYFTGWVTKTAEITKTIKKTNIAPEACNTIDASCYTVPSHLYQSCSTDQEDDNSTLTIDWNLYYDNNSYVDIDEDDVRYIVYDEDNTDWTLMESRSDNPVFNWTYNEERQYKLIETATDSNDTSNNAERIFPIVFEPCKTESKQSVQARGTIEVEANTWQLIAIPMTYGIWDSDSHTIIKSETRSTVKNVIIDQVEDIYNTEAKELIKVINASFGDNSGQMYNYVPGFTKETNSHNFKLVMIDDDEDVTDSGEKFEVLGFWIKSKDTNFIIKWGIPE